MSSVLDVFVGKLLQEVVGAGCFPVAQSTRTDPVHKDWINRLVCTASREHDAHIHDMIKGSSKMIPVPHFGFFEGFRLVGKRWK